MADQVRRNTEKLQSKVQELTAALEASNRQMRRRDGNSTRRSTMRA